MSERKKILFIAIANSSHTISWIELFKSFEEIEFSLFGINGSYTEKFEKMLFSGDPLFRILDSIFNFIDKQIGKNISSKILFKRVKTKLLVMMELNRLKKKIRRVKPDVIHTLGFDPSGYHLMELLEGNKFKKSFKWIHTSRGSELSLKGFLPEDLNKKVLLNCDIFIADSDLHYQLAIENGLEESKVPSFGIVPGAGGLNIDQIKDKHLLLNSKRDRIILWPKAYECPFSKALPVFESIKIAWEKIKPCRIIMTAATSETKMWFQSLPEEIRKSAVILDRMDREDYLEMLRKSKVLLAPSLSDGISNSLYEAMAYGVVPIVSKLDTYSDIFENGKNVLYAENLYPNEIAEALILAMNNDKSMDELILNNYKLVEQMADSATVRKNLFEIYQNI